MTDGEEADELFNDDEETSASLKASGAQSIERAFSIVRLLASKAPSSLRLLDIAKRVGLHRSTTYRLLRALEREGVVEREANSRSYTVGADLAWLGLGAGTRIPVRAAASPVLDWLSEAVGDAVFLTVRSGPDSVCADRRIGSYPIQVLSIAVGSRRPLGVSQGGRAILAFLKVEDAAEVIGQNSDRYAEFKVSEAMLKETIAAARRDGYLCSDGVTVRDTRVIAVPVLDINNMPIAAISVIATRHRIPSARIPKLAAILKEAASEISQRVVQQRASKHKASGRAV